MISVRLWLRFRFIATELDHLCLDRFVFVGCEADIATELGRVGFRCWGDVSIGVVGRRHGAADAAAVGLGFRVLAA